MARGERADAGRGRDVDRPRAGRVAFADIRAALGRADDHGGRLADGEEVFEGRLVEDVEFGEVFRGSARRLAPVPCGFRIVATRFSDDSRARDAATARPRRPAAPMRRTVGRSVDEVGFGMGGHSGDWDVLEVAFDTRATVAGHSRV